MGKYLAILCALFAAACSSESAVSPPPANPGSGGSGGSGNLDVDGSAPDEGGFADANGAQANESGFGDAGIPPNKEPVQVTGPLTRESCDAVCSAKTYQCSMLCNADTHAAGSTVYANTVNNFTVYKQPPIITCAEVVAATYEEFGTVYDLESYRCCCLAPKITRVPGDASNPTSCTDVCTAQGLTCNPETNFGGGKAGEETTWTDGASSTLILLHPCTYVPAKTMIRSGTSYTLTRYTCGCS